MALGDKLRGKTVGEIANLAVHGDEAAETAMKIIKQAQKNEENTNMSLYQEFATSFFGPFAELCSSGKKLVSVEGQFFLHKGPPSLIAIRLNFDNTSILITSTKDDSISLKLNQEFANQNEYQSQTLNFVAPWSTAISKPLLWAWIMINQQGYFDGLRLEFAGTSETTTSEIQLLVIGCEFKYQ